MHSFKHAHIRINTNVTMCSKALFSNKKHYP